MAKIILNNKEYELDDSALAPATADLKAHFLTTMSGTGATITLDGVAYNIDATKLSAAEDSFAAYLDAITGSTPDEERLEGDGAKFYTMAPTALSFRSTAPLNELQEVQINGVTVDPSNYTLEEGSTIVTFQIEYLKTLNVGSYEVEVVSESKSVKGGFNVATPELNEYGFYYNQPYTAYVELFGATTAFFIREDNTVDVTVFPDATEVCPYTISGNSMTITTSILGDVHLTISADGIYCTEVATNFVLGDETIVADEDYIYIYKEELGGYNVRPIDKTKAEYCKMKRGIYNKAVVSIAMNAFENNVNLINIPTQEVGFGKDSLITCIEESAFSGCTNLRKVTIPDSVDIIGYNAFSNCINIDDLSLPRVSEIGDDAFYGCIGLTGVTIPCETKYIGKGAFRNCSSLTEVFIASINSDSIGQRFIYEEAFADCTSLVDIIFNDTVAEWNAIIKRDGWNQSVPATYVHCTDGDVAL